MGAWGTGIYSNDLAADIREDFRDYIAAGYSPAEATKQLLLEYSVRADDSNVDNNDFWLALAYTQHNLGHVDPSVIRRALVIAKDSRELERWGSSAPKRQKVLDRVVATISQPAPSPKKLKKRVEVTTALEAGQHILWYPGHNRPEVALRVTDIQRDKGGAYPVVVVLSYDGSEASRRNIHRLKPISVMDSPAPGAKERKSGLGFILYGQPGDPEDLTILARRTNWRTPTIPQTYFVLPWGKLHEWFTVDGKVSRTKVI